MPAEAEPIDVEVLPPRRDGDTPDLSRLIAWILDDLIPIPGTKHRVGLDPLIGLIPGVGDGSSALIASTLLINALRAGVPRIVIVRMALNVLINAVLGALPGVGDVFSAVFKSNRRNYELLERHAGRSTRRASTRGDWIFVGALVGGVLLAAVAASIGVALLFWRLMQLIFGA